MQVSTPQTLPPGSTSVQHIPLARLERLRHQSILGNYVAQELMNLNRSGARFAVISPGLVDAYRIHIEARTFLADDYKAESNEEGYLGRFMNMHLWCLTEIEHRESTFDRPDYSKDEFIVGANLNKEMLECEPKTVAQKAIWAFERGHNGHPG
jgi:hypothetical protein